MAAICTKNRLDFPPKFIGIAGRNRYMNNSVGTGGIITDSSGVALISGVTGNVALLVTVSGNTIRWNVPGVGNHTPANQLNDTNFIYYFAGMGSLS